jgi:hypothetical protein
MEEGLGTGSESSLFPQRNNGEALSLGLNPCLSSRFLLISNLRLAATVRLGLLSICWC